MKKEEIQNLIKELVEKTTVKLDKINLSEEDSGNLWISLEVNEPHLFISHEGEGLHALNHLAHRIIENKSGVKEDPEKRSDIQVLIDINGFQKKHIDSVRAVAHMMSERARYFKSNIEVDPMTAFERRIVHEFLANAPDLETESIGAGNSRRVVIKYIGNLN